MLADVLREGSFSFRHVAPLEIILSELGRAWAPSQEVIITALKACFSNSARLHKKLGGGFY